MVEIAKKMRLRKRTARQHLSCLDRILRYIRYGFTVDLQRAGAVELYADILSGKALAAFSVL